MLAYDCFARRDALIACDDINSNEEDKVVKKIFCTEGSFRWFDFWIVA